MVRERGFRRRQHGHRPPIKGAISRCSGRFAAGYPLGMCMALEEQGVEWRCTITRWRLPPMRDRHQIREAGEARRLDADPQVHRAQCGAFLWQDGDFMPKPIVGDNGSGMHVHQSLWKGGQNLFSGNGYAGLSNSRSITSGIIKHAGRQCHYQPGTNSYKRLVPGFEARSILPTRPATFASVRIPYVSTESTPHRSAFPDRRQPYLAFTAMMMAGLDGIQNKIHPAIDRQELYDLPPEEAKRCRTCALLSKWRSNTRQGPEFLTRRRVFQRHDRRLYRAQDGGVTAFRMTNHPLEFQLYYSCRNLPDQSPANSYQQRSINTTLPRPGEWGGKSCGGGRNSLRGVLSFHFWCIFIKEFVGDNLTNSWRTIWCIANSDLLT